MLSPARILIVEDSPTVVSQLSRVLAEALPDAEVYAAPDIANARRLFDELRPRIVFLDVVLAGGSTGAQLLPTIARAPWEAHVVVLTGLAEDHPEVTLLRSHGAFAYVRKPVRRAAIANVLREIATESGAVGGRAAGGNR